MAGAMSEPVREHRRRTVRRAAVALAAVVSLWLGVMSGSAVARPSAEDTTMPRALPGCESDCITEFALAQGSRPFTIIAGPDGAVWFTMPGGRCDQGAGNRVGRITVDGQVTEFPLPTPTGLPGGITVGPDGAFWMGLQNLNRIGHMTLDGSVVEFPVMATATVRWTEGCTYETSRPAEGGIVVGPDGALWFGESAANNIARMTTDGRVTEYPIPTPNSNPIGITVGPDDALWFVERVGNKIGRITLDGAISEYPIPTPESISNAIIAGPDGALWFSELMGHKIGRITLDGEITEYPVPGVGPVGLVIGPDGALWMAGLTSKEIVRMTLDGTISHRYPVPDQDSPPLVITVGPDSNLWYTSQQGHKVGRVRIQP